MKRDLSKRIMALPLRAKASLIWRMFRDPDVPLVAKSVLPIIAGYLAMPFDIVPDFIPVAGQLDDLIVLGRPDDQSMRILSLVVPADIRTGLVATPEVEDDQAPLAGTAVPADDIESDTVTPAA